MLLIVRAIIYYERSEYLILRIKKNNLTYAADVKTRLHIHDFLYDSPRFTPDFSWSEKSGWIGMNRAEKWKYAVRMSTMLVRCIRYRYESMTIHDGNATVNED